ncbi:MAG: hypothetical protein JWM95_3518 [Gemmatimonadetes bacterium]|nr:hypothetical protein [Gemmatimonadota bacterium]
MKSGQVPCGITLISFAAFMVACSSGGSDGTGSAGHAAGGTTGTAGGAAGGTTGTAGGAGHGTGGAAGATTGTAGGAGQGTGGAAGATTGTGGAAGGMTGAAGNGDGSCNSLTVTGDYVPDTGGTGTALVPAGGSIADGTYVLTKIEAYPATSAGRAKLKSTLKVTGTVVQDAEDTDVCPGTRTFSYTAVTSGTHWAWTGTCASDGMIDSVTFGYTASAGTLVLFVEDAGAKFVETYTKQ